MDIPGYRIERKVGQGGMAMVYLAVQESLARPVALKVLNPMYADAPEFTQRFLNEGRMLASVAHTNVITIHDIGVADDVHYIAMEYVEGRDLRRRMRQGLSVPTTLEYLLTLASALDFAHQRGIVHRDIKPSNVLFRADGTLLLSDFGIAKQMGVHSDLTVTGSAIGSPHYLSPEQARGQPVDARADIYSLGVMLHEMLTGTKPYAGASDLDTMMLHVNEPVPSLPEELAVFQPVLERMMAKQPDGRFEEVSEMAQALRQAFAQWNGTSSDFEPTLASTRGSTLPGSVETLTDYVEPDTAQRRGARIRRGALVIGGIGAVAAAVIFTTEPDSSTPDQTRQGLGAERGSGAEVVAGTPRPEPAEASTGSSGTQTQAVTAGGGSAEAPAPNTAAAQTPAPALGDPPEPAGTVADGAEGSFTAATESAAEAVVDSPAPAARPASQATASPTTPPLATTAERTNPPSPATAATSATVEDTAQAAREAQLDTLLAAANEAIKDFRLTTPSGDNALTYLEQMLRIDSGNRAAREAFARIAERYAVLARSSLRKDELAKTELYLARGLEVDAGNSALRALRAELAARRPVRSAEPRQAGTATGGTGTPSSGGDRSAPSRPDYDTPAELFGRIKRLFTD